MSLTVRRGQTLNEAVCSRTQKKQSGNVAGAGALQVHLDGGCGGGTSLSSCFVGFEAKKRQSHSFGMVTSLIRSVAVGALGTEVTRGHMSFSSVGFSLLLSLISLSLSLFLSSLSLLTLSLSGKSLPLTIFTPLWHHANTVYRVILVWGQGPGHAVRVEELGGLQAPWRLKASLRPALPDHRLMRH